MLEKVMIKAWNELDQKATQWNLNYRLAAYVVAIQRISTAKKLRGMFP